MRLRELAEQKQIPLLRCGMTNQDGLYAKEGRHFVVEEAMAGTVGLDPFSVDDELRDGTLANVGDDLFGGAGRALDVDLCVSDGVPGEEALGLAAVAAPGCGVNEKFHESILR